MDRVVSISQYLSRTVVPVECTIPADMTIEQWRRQRRRQPQAAESCNHLCDTTTRYEHEQKLLHFLIVCAECGTEQLIETVSYEPQFVPSPAADAAETPAAATVHRLPRRRWRRGRPDRLPRAA
jgi:hypothetical protein